MGEDKNAATVGSPTEHAKSPIIGTGSPDVLIESRQAWRGEIDRHACPEHGDETVVSASDNVLINGRGATRLGHFLMSEGNGPPNKIQGGAAQVYIGETGVGILNRDLMALLVKDLCALKRDWAKLSPDARFERYKNAIADHFGRIGMPMPDIRRFADSEYNGEAKGWSGFWAGNKWELAVKGSYFNGAWPGKFLGGVAGHEIRHGEQDWYALRKRATEIRAQNNGGNTEADRQASINRLVDTTGVDREAATAAVDNPLERGSREWKYASVVERGSLSGYDWADINEKQRRTVNDLRNGKLTRAEADARNAANMVPYHHRPVGSDANEAGLFGIEKMMDECCP